MATEHRNPCCFLHVATGKGHPLLVPVMLFNSISSAICQSATLTWTGLIVLLWPPRAGADTFHGTLLYRTPTWRLRLKLGRPSSSCSSPRGRCRRGLPGPPRQRKQQLPAVVLRYASTRARWSWTMARCRWRCRRRRAGSPASTTAATARPPTCWGTTPARETPEGN